jgi:M6 family metalloprotease-like protein
LSPGLPPLPTPNPCIKAIQTKYSQKSTDLGIATSGINASTSTCWQTYQAGAIYWTSSTGAHEVHGRIWSRYNTLGGPANWGYPLSDETVVSNFSGYGRYNQFEKGRIYYYPDTDAVEVKKLEEVFEPEQTDIAPCKLGQTVGTRKVLAILINPHVKASDINPSDAPIELTMPSKADVESALFGTISGAPVTDRAKSNVRDYYLENSLDKLKLENAGILPYVGSAYDAPAGKTGKHYWDNTSQHIPCNNDGWLNGHEERWADAVKLAANDFDFKKYDTNGDNRLTPDELAIVVVGPSSPGGERLTFVGGYNINKTGPCTTWTSNTFPLTVGGLTFTQFVEWFSLAPTASSPIQLGLPAHELGHLVTGFPDLYMDSNALAVLSTPSWQFDGGIFSRMSAPISANETTHFDPFLKLKAGWLNYTVAMGSGTYTLRDAETYGDALVLYDPTRGRDEYFILEYRRPGVSYDAGRGAAGGGLPNAGLAVWHVIEDSGRQQILKPQPPSVWNFYRRGVLLIRANGGKPVNDKVALFMNRNTNLPLTWSDGSRVSLAVTLLDDTNPTPIPIVSGGAQGTMLIGPSPSAPPNIRLLVTLPQSITVY